MNSVKFTRTRANAFQDSRLRTVRLRALSICLSSVGFSQAAVPAYAAPQTWIVKNCDDSGMDSLREIVSSPTTHSGDIVDLSELPARCGTANSTITLLNGEIVAYQTDLTLIGPAEGEGSVSISGGNASRALNHQGVGTLALESLTIANGSYLVYGVPGDGYGGCINSEGSVFLSGTTVTNCHAFTNTGTGGGGGIRALNVTLILSRVSNSHEGAQGHKSCGGGVKANTLFAKYSSLSGNHGNRGGGACADNMTIIGSTIDHNSAVGGGGLYTQGSASIRNSTLSENEAVAGSALEATGIASSVAIINSTAAFNYNSGSMTGAVYFVGTSASTTLTLQSSIIAKNTTGAAKTPADIYIFPGQGVLDSAGADNLVIASNIPSPPGVITVTGDPKLGPLQFNGGWTQTHALLPGSPALGMGNNTASLTHDQRGVGYPRTTGPIASVDIGAFQFDTIFASGFGFAE